MERGVSVIICCYNSAWIIQRTLESLKTQRFRFSIPYEIVLVDNKCTDNTVAIAEDTMENGEIDFKIVRENEPGLANARRKGIKEIKYEYVIFCDDDNLLCTDYISTAIDILDKMPDVGAVGGKGIAEFEIEPAEIIKDHLDCYAVGSQTEHKDWLYGAGLALRTSLVRDIYNNQQCYMMGRKGSELLSGDDSELVMSIVLRGHKIYATDDIFFTHVLKANRLTEEYFHRLYKGLILPLPAFDVMRAAIYGNRFCEAIKDYLYYYKRYIKYSIVFWKPFSKSKRELAFDKVEQFRYWGIFRLHKIYRQWIQIKQRSVKYTPCNR